MKILQLVTMRQYRGAEVFAATLSIELIKLGHEIIFVGLYKNCNNILEVPNATNLDLVERKSSAFSPFIVKKLVSLVKNTKPDVVQCNGSDTLKYMVAGSFFMPKIPILYRNISMISKWMSGLPKKIMYHQIFNRISHVSSVGNETIEDFITTFRFPREKTSVIRRGIPVNEIDKKDARKKLVEQLGLSPDDKIVMHIGNFSPEKNHIFLIDIFYDLKNINPNIKLVCVGDGILFSNIQDEITGKKLEKTVYLVGFEKNIPLLLAAADFCVLPSKVEGVPGVILEAAIQKKPTIATNVGGVKEVLIDKETGFCIEDFSKVEFTNKILELTTNFQLLDSMGNKAYALALNKFNPSESAKRFESLYSKLSEKQLMVY